MSTALPPPPPARHAAPTHLDLPDTDGRPVLSSAEPTQTRILTESIRPVLQRIHADGRYFIGQSTGLYWRITDPPLDGCKAPDWYYVPDVSPAPPDFPYRRSYVLWQEHVAPLIVIEYVSDDTGEEWDRTPHTGKLWVYEQAVHASYYAIYTHLTGALEVYERVGTRFRRMAPNTRGRYLILPLEAELGTLRGTVDEFTLDWLRWFDPRGNLYLFDEERYNRERLERERAERAARDAQEQAVDAQDRANQAEDRARVLADKLRELGIDPTTL